MALAPLEIPELPQPGQHSEWASWAERLTVALSQIQERLRDYSGNINTELAAVLGAIPSPYEPPIGVIWPWPGGNLPSKWLWCAGQELLRTTYSSLDNVLGTTYGAYTNGAGGAGTTHLRLPDSKNRAFFGRDAMGGTPATNRITNSGTGNPGISGATLGATGGADRHTLTEPQTPVITPAIKFSSGAAAGGGGSLMRGSPDSGVSTGFANSHGSGEAHPQMPPALILNFIIYAGV